MGRGTGQTEGQRVLGGSPSVQANHCEPGHFRCRPSALITKGGRALAVYAHILCESSQRYMWVLKAVPGLWLCQLPQRTMCTRTRTRACLGYEPGFPNGRACKRKAAATSTSLGRSPLGPGEHCAGLRSWAGGIPSLWNLSGQRPFITSLNT